MDRQSHVQILQGTHLMALNPKHRAVYDVLRQMSGGCYMGSIMARLPVKDRDHAAVLDALQALERAGLVTRSGGGEPILWRAVRAA